MRFPLFLGLCLLLFPGQNQLHAQERSSWQVFSPIEGRFKVNSPGKMDHQADTIDTKIGPLVYHTYFCAIGQEKVPDFVYMVSFVDYPPATVHSDSTALLTDFFAATMDQAAFSIAGEVIYQQAIRVAGFPGYLWRINYHDDGVIKTKALLAENRYYAIQAVTHKAQALSSDVDRFLDSFQILPTN